MHFGTRISNSNKWSAGWSVVQQIGAEREAQLLKKRASLAYHLTCLKWIKPNMFSCKELTDVSYTDYIVVAEMIQVKL